jgi:hypothetical protein
VSALSLLSRRDPKADATAIAVIMTHAIVHNPDDVRVHLELWVVQAD